MNEILKVEISKIKNDINKIYNIDISEQNAFEILSCELFCIKDFGNELIIQSAKDCITNGPNDGGIDFVYFDDEDSKVILGQCKYSTNFTPNELVAEMNKMSSTIENFKKRQTGQYSSKLREVLQNALDSLPNENAYNVEYQFFITSEVNQEELYTKIANEHNVYSKDMVTIFDIKDIVTKINDNISNINTVNEFKIKIDKTKNYLEYETNKHRGIMINMTSVSLIDMYNKFRDKGLFDLNIRKYVGNRQVDNGIKKTLDKDRDNFWFLNNGIIIACEDFEVDGDKVSLFNFSIVNGGQTTNRIGEYKGSNNNLFMIPCKIISKKIKRIKIFITKLPKHLTHKNQYILGI
jgi:AIPR protein.